MLSPILYAINNFDAAKGTTVKFYYTGEQVFANKLTIKKNDTLEVVYEQKVSSMRLNHEISAEASSTKLINGTTYVASITVFDKNGIESPASNTVLFTCYTTPVFHFTNIREGDILTDASYPVKLVYSQKENIPLSQYIVNLYDYGHNQIWSSGAIYNDKELSVVISGLTDNSNYYIRATGNTVTDVPLDTGLIGFSVNIVNPNTFLVLSLENVPDESSVKVSSNIVIVVGRSEGDISYIDNAAVDLTHGGKVIFDDGFNLKNDFTINGIWKNLKDFSQILELTNGRDVITVHWNYGDFGNGKEYYAELYAKTKINNTFVLTYVVQSNLIKMISPNSCIQLLIQKSNSAFNIVIKDLGEVAFT